MRFLPNRRSALPAEEIECRLEKEEPKDARATDDIECSFTPHGDSGAKILDRSQNECTRVTLHEKHSFCLGGDSEIKDAVEASRTSSSRFSDLTRQSLETETSFLGSRGEEEESLVESHCSERGRSENEESFDKSESRDSSIDSFHLQSWATDSVNADNGFTCLNEPCVPCMEEDESFSLNSVESIADQSFLVDNVYIRSGRSTEGEIDKAHPAGETRASESFGELEKKAGNEVLARETVELVIEQPRAEKSPCEQNRIQQKEAAKLLVHKPPSSSESFGELEKNAEMRFLHVKRSSWQSNSRELRNLHANKIAFNGKKLQSSSFTNPHHPQNHLENLRRKPEMRFLYTKLSSW